MTPMNQRRPDIENIIERTFYIRTSFESGTALVIEFDKHQYLITAKHVVIAKSGRIVPGDTIQIYPDSGRGMEVPVKAIATNPEDPDKGGIDVAVLELSQTIDFDGESPVVGCPDDLFITQNMAMPSTEHFAEFGTSFGVTTRSGTIAKIVSPDNRGPYSGDFLIGIEAYPGFSGSPIICWDSDGQTVLVGVAARYSWRKYTTFGSVPIHSGFIGCFHIQHAFDLIRTIRGPSEPA